MLNLFRAFKGPKSATAKLVVKPAHQANIIMYHVWALLVIIAAIILLYTINWIAGLCAFTLALTFFWFSLFVRLPVFRLSENDSAFVTLFNRPISLIWAGNGKVEVLNIDDPSGSGTILRLEEVYTNKRLRVEDKLLALMTGGAGSIEKAREYFSGRKRIFYKVRRTSRRPKNGNVQVPIPTVPKAKKSSDLSDFRVVQEQMVNKSFSPDKIYYEFEGNNFSVLQIACYLKLPGFSLNGSAAGEFPENFPDDFFEAVTGGFFVIDEKDGEKRQISVDIDTVLDAEIIRVPQEGFIVGKDQSNNQISGGLFFVGLWPFFNIHTYRQRWASQETNGAIYEKNEYLQIVPLRDDQYVLIFDHVEVQDMLQVTLHILITSRTVNPFHALFGAQMWLEMIAGLIRQNVRPIIGGLTIDQVRESKASIGQTLSAVIMAKVCDPKGAMIENRYGVKIHSVDTVDITPENVTEANPLALPFIARQKKLARVTEGEAERDYLESVGAGKGRQIAQEGSGRADAIRKETSAIEENPAVAIPLAYIRGLEKVGDGAGNTVLVGADILQALKSLGASALKRIPKEGE